MHICYGSKHNLQQCQRGRAHIPASQIHSRRQPNLRTPKTSTTANGKSSIILPSNERSRAHTAGSAHRAVCTGEWIMNSYSLAFLPPSTYCLPEAHEHNLPAGLRLRLSGEINGARDMGAAGAKGRACTLSSPRAEVHFCLRKTSSCQQRVGGRAGLLVRKLPWVKADPLSG